MKAPVRSRISRRFFYRILAILMTLSLLPYLIFNLFFVTRIKSELTANTQRISQQELTRTAKSISQSMETMQKVLFYISSANQPLLDKRISLRDLDVVTKNRYLDTISQLAAIANNEAVYLCLYDSASDIMIASKYGVTSCAGNPRFNWLPDEIKTAGDLGCIYMTPARLHYISSNNSGYYSAIIQPANNRDGLPMAALFVINIQSMTDNLLSAINAGSSAYTCYMINQDGSIIYHPDEKYIATRLDPAILTELTATGAYGTTGSRVLNAFPISGTAMYLVSEIDTSVLYGWIDCLNRQLLLVTGIIMTVLVITVVFLSIVLYQPIRDVLKHVSSSRPDQSLASSEFDYIRSAFDQIEDKYQHAADNLQSTRQVLQRATLLNSIQGGLANSQLEAEQDQFKQKYTVRVIWAENAAERTNALTWLEQCVPGIEIFHETQTVLGIVPDTAFGDVQSARQNEADSPPPELLIALGQASRPLDSLYRSYLEATLTVLINHLLGRSGICLYSDLFSQPYYTSGLAGDLLQGLQSSISCCDVREFTAQILEALPSGLLVAEFNRRVVAIMILMISQQPDEATVLTSDFIDQFRHSLQLDPQRIRRFFIQNFRETASRHHEESSSMSVHLQTMSNFVERNYDKLISLEDVVQAVGVSKQYFCYLVKKAYNMTFTNYLNHYRIEKAKVLLQNPSIRIDQINCQVGYSSSSYFIKVFKQNTGLTPGDYRKMIVSAPKETTL